MADIAFTAVTLFWMFIAAVMFGGFSFIMMMLLALLTPALPFLKAKLKKVPILAVRRTDRKIDYVPVTKFIQPLAMHKEYGGFIVDPDSVYNALRGGVSILPVNGEIGITLREKVLGIIDALKKAKINNVEEAEWLSDRWGACACGYMGIGELMDDGTLLCPNSNVEVKHEAQKGAPAEKPPLYVSDKDREQPGAPDAKDTAGAVGTGDDPQL